MKKLFSILFLITFIMVGCSQTKAPIEQSGGKAPDFSLDNIKGGKISLSDYKGKDNVLLVFWATWCPFCVEEIPELNKLTDTHKDKFKIIGIDIKEDSEKVKNFVEKRTIRYDMVIDTTGSVAQSYGVIGIPTNVLIDKDGNILYKGNSLDECKKDFDKLQ